MAFIITLKNYYFRIIIKNETKSSILSIFAFKNYGKFTDHNLEKLCPRSLVLASTIPVLGLERVCSQKVGSWPRFFFESLTSNVVFTTSPLSKTLFCWVVLFPTENTLFRNKLVCLFLITLTSLSPILSMS